MVPGNECCWPLSADVHDLLVADLPETDMADAVHVLVSALHFPAARGCNPGACWPQGHLNT